MASSSSLVSFSLPKTITASSSSSSAETLEQKFGRKGIKFVDSSVELTVRNGSSLKLEIPNAHITSYKPKVYWKDDGFEEVLYTLEGSKGGIGLVINEEGGANVNTSEWSVKDVDSDAIDALQVELHCTRGTLDLTYVVSLYPLSTASAVIVKNTGRKPINLTGGILSHYKFRNRNGAGIQGLNGCTYLTHPPLSSPHEILSPFEAIKPEDSPGFFSFGYEPEKNPGEWTHQDVPITVLKHKLSRVYAAPPSSRSNPFHCTIPSKYETIDQGRELFFRVIRMGFEDVYLSSPGSTYEKYGKEYFICTGPVTVLVPHRLEPGEEWRGAQVIEHDNL